MLIWRETGLHLFIWMNVVSEITKTVTKFLHVGFQQAHLAGDIYELRKAPFVKPLYAAVGSLRAGRSPIKARWLFLCRAEKDGFQYTAA